MHNNYYFLSHLSAALEVRLSDAVLAECFSQNKNELVFIFLTPRGEFFLRAYLGADFSCLSFPQNFHRARKNSVDLFTPLVGQRCTGVRQHLNERSFRLVFEAGLDLLFRMHGNRANALILHNGAVEDTFRKQVKSETDNLDRTIDWSYEHFLASRERLRETYFTLGKVVWACLESEGFANLEADAQWQRLVSVREELGRGVFYIVDLNGTPTLSLLAFGDVLATYTDPIQAVDVFYRMFTQSTALMRERQRLLSSLRQQYRKTASWLESHRARLAELKAGSKYRLWADLIMAHLESIGPEDKTVWLPAFDGHSRVEVKLKVGLTPQKNAEIYYAKAKNATREIAHLERLVREKERLLEDRLSSVREVTEAASLDALREAATEARRQEGREPAMPYREYEYMGFRIRVGRNAEANDRLLQQFTAKDDLWLHARDVPGSHVIVKHQAGKKIPRPVIERAAQLAAYHSKRRNETLCPVICVPRKFVRKRKGDPPGTVRVDREEVILATPTA